MKGNAEFKINTWTEESFSELEGAGKLSRASVTKSYSGDISGEGVLEYLMTYHANGSAEFSGVERVVGKIENRAGSFVLHHSGRFEDGVMTQQSTIVAGSATGELAGLQGQSTVSAGHQQVYPFEFEYVFA